MIELVLKKYFDENLQIKSYLELPEKKPIEFIKIEKIGSSRKNMLESSIFTIQSYSESIYKASVINKKIKDLLINMIKLKEISKVSINSDYNFTDTKTKTYRYQLVAEIWHY